MWGGRNPSRLQIKDPLSQHAETALNKALNGCHFPPSARIEAGVVVGVLYVCCAPVEFGVPSRRREAAGRAAVIKKSDATGLGGVCIANHCLL